MKERNGVVDNSHISLGRATTLTGDPVDVGRGLTEEAAQQLHKEQNRHLHQPVHDATIDFNSPGTVDEFSIPGLDPDVGVEGGVDAAADDSGCEGGACKI